MRSPGACATCDVAIARLQRRDVAVGVTQRPSQTLSVSYNGFNGIATMTRAVTMTCLSIQQVQAQLPELIHQLAPGDEVLIMEDDRPVARIVPPLPAKLTRKLGSLRDTVLHLASDFDEPLEEFREYIE
jgi:antitoxin (DNA-binding transcriptional repressor) of toxin-antitoxin stability system